MTNGCISGSASQLLGAKLRDIEIPLPADLDCITFERIIEEAVAESGLQVSLRGSLKKFPGCIHWHLKKGRTPGTLEITWWPQQRRAWFTVQSGRTAPWITGEIARLGKMIRVRLRGA